TVTYDQTAPAIGFDLPVTGTAYQTATSYTVQFDATDNVAMFGGTNDWELQRQIATPSSGTCGTFANDTAASNKVTGTNSALNQTSLQSSLVDGKCYRWTLTATDQNGNTATTVTSGAILIDSSPATPNPPDVSAANATGIYQSAANQPVFFKP